MATSASGSAPGLQLTDFNTKINTSMVMYVNIGSTQISESTSKLVTFDVFVEM